MVVRPETAPPARSQAQAGPVAADHSLTGLVAGRVVDATTGAGLSNVIVWLSSVPGRATTAPTAPFPPQRVLVDRDGAFVFNRLPAGTYFVRAEKRGYAEGALGRREPSGVTSAVDLRDGEIRANLTVGLWKYAAIEGRILDDVGEPAAGVTVIALRRRIVAGHGRWVRSRSNTTDDRGMFRVNTLEPGDYCVFVPASQSAFAGEIAGSPVTHQATFYPVASSPSSLNVIALQAGQERTGVQMQLRVVRSVRVSGTLTTPDGPAASTAVRIMPAFADELATDQFLSIEVATGRSDESGTFTMTGVPPGEYLIQAEATRTPSPFEIRPMQQAFWAAQPISVGSSDVTNVAVTLRPGLRVSGRLEFAGGIAAPTAAQITRGWVWLLPATNGALEGGRTLGRAAIDATGRFTTQAVPGGKYVLRVDGVARWAMASAWLGSRDVADSPIDLTSGDVSEVVVQMTNRQTSLSGPVLDALGAPDGDASVLIFPTDPALWVDSSAQPRRLRAGRTDDAGAFVIEGAPPGEYFVVAIGAATVGDWRDPRVLDRLARVASRVTLADGERRAVSLKTVPRPAGATGGGDK